MYTRTLEPPGSAFFLFGSRGTGKSTWVRSRFPEALVVNLLPSENTVRYEHDPSFLRAQVLARRTSDWIVLDEVQRVPKLLDGIS